MSSEQTCPVQFDPYDEEIQGDIYGAYEKIHAASPISWVDRHGGYWVVTGYREVFEMARDWQHFSSLVWGERGIFKHAGPRLPPVHYDPPEQQEWRQLLNPYFTPARMAQIEPGARAVATRLIDEFIEAGEADLFKDLGSPLPGMVFFSHVMQVPLEDLQQLRTWVDTIQYQGFADPEVAKKADGEFTQYLYQFIEGRRSAPADGDVVDMLLTAELNGHRMSDEEIMSAVMLLIFGGIETTSNAIANALHYIESHADDRRRLLDDRQLFPTAVEEFLRYEGGLHGKARVVTDGVELFGVKFRKGEKVLLSFAGANRDPQEYPEPTRCIIDRPANRHLAFGLGVHRCLGSNLARMNIRITLEEVLRRVPDFRLKEGAETPLQGAITRGYTALPVRFTPGRRLGPAAAAGAANA